MSFDNTLQQFVSHYAGHWRDAETQSFQGDGFKVLSISSPSQLRG